MTQPDELAGLREQIDAVDADLVELLGRRFELTRQVGWLKAGSGLASLDSGREHSQNARFDGLAEAAQVAPALVRQVFDDVRSQVRHEHDLTRTYTIAQMQQAERRAGSEFGVSLTELMDRAGKALALAAVRMGAGGAVLVACGTGNNGGDGYVCATELLRRGVDVTVCAVRRDKLAPGTLADDAAAAYEAAGGRVMAASLDLDPGGVEAELIVDALFGSGLSRPVEGLYAHLVSLINNCGVPVLSADIPSGVNGNTGEVLGVAVRATRTVMMGLAKPACVTPPGSDYFGDREVADILPAGLVQLVSGVSV